MKKKAILIILDGFGEGEKNNSNAIYLAKTPFIDNLKKNYSTSLLEAGGGAVGVLPGQTGGSDIGHNTIGAGKVVRQAIKVIYDAVQDQTFFKNEKLLKAINHAKKNNSNLHLFGIGADSYIHAYLPFLYSLLDLLVKENFQSSKVFLHLAADGRDNPPQSGLKFFTEIEKECQKRKMGVIASIFGRFYLDRGKNWERTEKIYNLLTDKNQKYISDWKNYFQKNYKNNITDEFFEPIAVGDEEIFSRIKDNDAVINFCYRADRERQITEALTATSFTNFTRRVDIKNLSYVGFIQYAKFLDKADYAFTEDQASICLSEVLEQNGLRQMHIAGREKIIFVTYNLNRCQDLNLSLETDLIADQTKEVDNFEKNPEMSAPNITKNMLKSLKNKDQDVYIINYENCDQVGHTGNMTATIKAVEAVDKSLSEIIPVALENDFEILITADHGNADQMKDDTGHSQTAHSANKVPCIFISEKNKHFKLKNGELSDIAPTFLKILDIRPPQEMTGKNLLDF